MLTLDLSGQIVKRQCAEGAILNPADGLTTILFVPGSRPERFAKALASGADMVCIDLEDAVASDDKSSARDAALAALASDATGRLAIRINGVNTADGLRDILALRELGDLPPLIFVPMVEDAAQVALVRSVLAIEDERLVPLIETGRGLRGASEIAAAPAVAAVMFGGGDLSSELGVALEWEPLAVARAQLIIACAGARVSAIDVPYVRLDDEAGLREEALRAKTLGFSAKAAIHPSQVPGIADIFRPTEAEADEARRALDAYRSAGGRAIRHEGRMLEAPLIRRYQAIVAKWEKQGHA
jgi:citrate lyase beta subunit